MPSTLTTHITTRLHDSEIREVESRAEQDGRTKCAWIAQAVREALQRRRTAEQ